MKSFQNLYMKMHNQNLSYTSRSFIWLQVLPRPLAMQSLYSLLKKLQKHALRSAQ